MTSEEKKGLGLIGKDKKTWNDRTGKTDIIYASPESLVGD